MIGVVEEKKKANAVYYENLAEGNTVVIAETGTHFNADLITCKIGNLMPSQSIQIKFSYI